jgi:alpha-galactosidase
MLSGVSLIRLRVCWLRIFTSRGVKRLIAGKTSSARDTEAVVATQFAGRTDADGFPTGESWENASPIQFDHDWQGKNNDPHRETQARLLWSLDALYVRFLARYRSITVFSDSEPNGRRDHLWDRDVAEVFLQPPGSDLRHYKEFEVSPNGFWIDLDIVRGEKRDLESGLKRRVRLDEQKKIWTAEIILAMTSLTAHFDPTKAWKANFFRVEGASEPRFYSAWKPTGTPIPNFHVPEVFGVLTFEK